MVDVRAEHLGQYHDGSVHEHMGDDRDTGNIKFPFANGHQNHQGQRDLDGKGEYSLNSAEAYIQRLKRGQLRCYLLGSIRWHIGGELAKLPIVDHERNDKTADVGETDKRDGLDAAMADAERKAVDPARTFFQQRTVPQIATTFLKEPRGKPQKDTIEPWLMRHIRIPAHWSQHVLEQRDSDDQLEHDEHRRADEYGDKGSPLCDDEIKDTAKRQPEANNDVEDECGDDAGIDHG